jgi:uncharacterized protein YqeY
MVQQQLEQDLKNAMLAGDTQRVTVLRSLKSAIGYARVAGKEKVDLSEADILQILAKEAKKRQEGADGFMQAGDKPRAEQELAEKAIIETYLPPALSEAEVTKLVDEAIAELEEVSPRAMGQVIAKVKAASEGRADGALIARLTKERLQ